MTLIVFILSASLLGVVIASLWRGQIWKLFTAVTVASSLVGLSLADWPSASAVFHDVWSFLWFLFNYGLFFAPAVLAANCASAVILLVRKKLVADPKQKI